MADYLSHIAEYERMQQAKGISASVSIQGTCAEYKIHYYKKTPRPRGDRQAIKTFSDRARLAMLKHFHRIDFIHHVAPLFITLTYPDERATPSYDERVAHRKSFHRRMERALHKRIPCAWRLEWMPRQTGELIGRPCPHWHLLVFRHRFIPYELVNQKWAATIRHKGYVRTECKRLYDDEPIRLYMAKYISKEACPLSLVIPTNQDRLGAQNGWLRKEEIPLHDKRVYSTLSEAQRSELTTVAAERLLHKIPELEESFTLLGENAADVQRILDGEDLTGE